MLNTSFAQDSVTKVQNYSYAYIAVSGKVFSRKLNVVVDLGETQQQISEGEKYSKLLSDKKSYAAILNFMVQNGYELVETLDHIQLVSGSGGTTGIVFIMRKVHNIEATEE